MLFVDKYHASTICYKKSTGAVCTVFFSYHGTKIHKPQNLHGKPRYFQEYCGTAMVSCMVVFQFQ